MLLFYARMPIFVQTPHGDHLTANGSQHGVTQSHCYFEIWKKQCLAEGFHVEFMTTYLSCRHVPPELLLRFLKKQGLSESFNVEFMTTYLSCLHVPRLLVCLMWELSDQCTINNKFGTIISIILSKCPNHHMISDQYHTNVTIIHGKIRF